MRFAVIWLILGLILPLCATNVGGWIYEDTVWSAENSPYVVESYLYVAANVTLSIEPGVQVLVKGGDIQGDQADFHWTGTSDSPIEPVAKRIIVHGKISARGSYTLPIIFDVYESEIYHRWSGIESAADAQESVFEYCHFKHSYLYYDSYQSSYPISGALIYRNSKINVRYCEFINNRGAIGTFLPGIQGDTIIYGCKFATDDYVEPTYNVSIASNVIPEPKLIIARCEFSGRSDSPSCNGVKQYMLFNRYVNYTEIDNRQDDMPRLTFQRHFYGNTSVNSRVDLGLFNTIVSDTVFFRRNSIIYDNTTNFSASLWTAQTYPSLAVFSDNYIRGNLEMRFESENTDIYNNVFETGTISNYPLLIGDDYESSIFNKPRIYNNVFLNVIPDSTQSPPIFECRYFSPLFINNTVVRYVGVAAGSSQVSPKYYNNIFDGYSYPILPGNIDGNPPSFYHNCLEIPFPYEPYPFDGGGNIIAAPLYADSLGGDFSLQEGSPCIDAGLNITELPEFDIRYHKRVVPGSPGASEVVDMGAYEFNSVYIGGISGYVYDADTQIPLDCARIDIEGKLPEFSDISGRFPFPTGAGTYTLRVSRWDYDDIVIPNVSVVIGENTRVNIAMHSTSVANDDASAPPAGSNLGLANYPNPFNPQTNISFELAEPGYVRLSVYNLRGQKVKSIADFSLAKGQHTYFWDGKNEQNKAASPGLYILNLSIDGKRALSKKVTLIR